MMHDLEQRRADAPDLEVLLAYRTASAVRKAPANSRACWLVSRPLDTGTGTFACMAGRLGRREPDGGGLRCPTTKETRTRTLHRKRSRPTGRKIRASGSARLAFPPTTCVAPRRRQIRWSATRWIRRRRGPSETRGRAGYLGRRAKIGRASCRERVRA